MPAVVVQAEDRFGAPEMDRESGSALGWNDRLFIGYRDGKIFDYGDWAARDMAAMMRKPGKHRQIEAVLTYPTTAAERSITTGKKGSDEIRAWTEDYFELDGYSGGCETPLDLVIDQMTSAAIYKKSFHEIEWTEGVDDYAGQVVPKGVYWRPQTTTRLLRSVEAGNKPVAIEQDPLHLIGKVRGSGTKLIEIKINRVLLHIHGARRDPVNGLSDMEVPYWAYKTQQKIMFLWMQFAEGVSLPKAIVRAQDPDTATAIGKQVAAAGGSGVIPIGTDGRPDSVAVDVLDLSGSGPGPFKDLMSWLDQSAVDSVLAGFLTLTSTEKSGGGWALSSDSSDFFLQTLESKNREIERDLRGGLFAPMVRWNFGPKAVVPELKFEPLTAEDRKAAVTMMEALLSGRDPGLVPDEFLSELGRKVGDYLGMDGAKIGAAFNGSAERAAKLAEQKSAQAASLPGQQVARVAAGVGAATKMVQAAKKRDRAASG